MSKKEYTQKLVNQIKDCGQELINNAEDYVPSESPINDFKISIDFGINENCFPIIRVESKVIPKTYIERLEESKK